MSNEITTTINRMRIMKDSPDIADFKTKVQNPSTTNKKINTGNFKLKLNWVLWVIYTVNTSIHPFFLHVTVDKNSRWVAAKIYENTNHDTVERYYRSIQMYTPYREQFS